MRGNLNLKDHVGIVRELFKGKVDSQGSPYWLHCYRVALRAYSIVIKHYPTDFAQRVFLVALYHDVLEDTDITFQALKKLIGYELSISVLHLTKPTDKILESLNDDPEVNCELYAEYEMLYGASPIYDEWIETLIQNCVPTVLLIKYLDNLDNSEPWRAFKTFGTNGLKYKNSREMLYNAIKDDFPPLPTQTMYDLPRRANDEIR